MLVLLFITACFLAFSNGANDNFKGVATLFGSGTTSYKVALNWATLTTMAGSVAAVFLAGALVENFSGKGLVPDELLQGPEFAVAVAFGAAFTVFLATRIGMPVSTTHSIVGALFGGGLVAVGSSFNFIKLLTVFLIPLLMSPLIAGVLSLLTYFVFRRLRLSFGFTKETCICVGNTIMASKSVIEKNTGIVAISSAINPVVRIDHQENCQELYNGAVMGVGMQRILDAAHFFSAGIVSFARGLNDTPKIAGLLLVANLSDIKVGIAAIAITMAIGGLLNASLVGTTISKKITKINHGQGFTANLITGLLVTTASIHGMPVSTTHVSVGSIFGIGMVSGKMDFKVVTNILLSWMLTLPVAAVITAMIYFILNN